MHKEQAHPEHAIEPHLARAFADTFIGRDDLYPIQRPDGSYVTTYWARCDQLDNPDEARKQLLAKLVDRVFVYDDQVIAIALHGNFGVILGEGTYVPSEVLATVSGLIKKGANTVDDACTQFGSDGGRALACIRPLVFVPRHVALGSFSQMATAA